MSIVPDNLTTAYSLDWAIPLAGQEESPPKAKRWNREEYYRLAELGFIPEKHVELIDGVICEVSPHSFEHYWSIEVVARLLEKLFGESYWVRRQGPCVHGEWSEPEPDITVAKGSIEEFSAHPTTAVLAVEVSKTSLAFDKGRKASLYAAMEVPDYWVLDLNNRQLWVHRKPIVDDSVPFGHRYSDVTVVPADGSIAPLEHPGKLIAISQMLPPPK